MHNSVATSIRLPEGADALLNIITKDLHISRAQFMREAIMAKIEDELDIKLIEKVIAKNEKKYSLKEVKRELGLEN